MAGVSPTTISGIESGKITRPHLKTLLKIARALGADVGELRESGKVEAPPSPTQPPLNGFEEERRFSRFSEAIVAVAAKWGEAVADPDMNDTKRFGVIDAALELSDVISERVEEEDWEAIPNEERLEIVTAMEQLNAVAEKGVNHLKSSAQTESERQRFQERREKIRQWTSQISA